MISLSLSNTGDSVVISLVGYLGTDRFTKFREVMANNGCTYDAGLRKNFAQFTSIASLLKDFNSRGLPVAIDATITSRLNEDADRARSELALGRLRLDACRERLAKQRMPLFRYQETGIEWLAPRKRALLGDEPGLGKTPQALLAMDENAAALVICPGVAVYNWAGEVRKWRPDMRPIPIKSSATFRWPQKGEVVICSFGVIPIHERPEPSRVNTLLPNSEGPMCIEDYGMPAAEVTLVIDEAHFCKSTKTARTKRVRAVAKVITQSNGRVWMLTGTPMKNRELELWTVLETCKLGTDAFGKYPAFAAAIAAKHNAIFTTKLQRVMLRRRKDEVLKDLPPKRRADIMVALDERTASMCDELVAVLKARGKDVDDVLSAMKDRIVFEKISAVRAAVATAKIPMMIDLIEQAEEAEMPLVVGCAHREPIDALAGREGWRTITGDTSFEERFQIAQDFQAGLLKGVAGTIGAMGVAINLTYASNMVMVDLQWTPADNVQFEDRIRRIGQTSAVLIRRIVANHEIDMRVIELLTQKQELIERTVDASSVGEDHTAPSPAEQLAHAAATAAAAPQAAAMSDAQIEEMKQRDREAIEQQTKAEADGRSDGREYKVNLRARSAVNAVEDWARDGMIRLAGMDPDNASVINGEGFSKFDNDFGHSLAAQLNTSGMLTTKQWDAAVRLANRYRRQIGMPPNLQLNN